MLYIKNVRSVLIFLLALTVLLSVSACSDVRLSDISTSKPPVIISPGTTAAEGASSESESESETTAPSLNLGTDPEEIYADSANTMRVDFLNTGKSDAMIFRIDSKVVLIDTGNSNDYGRISSYLQAYGIDTVDIMIITHFDNDHVGSAEKIVENYNVKQVYVPDYIRNSSKYRGLITAVNATYGDTQLVRVTEDVSIEFQFGSMWINPTKLYEGGQIIGSDEANEFSEENNYSLIVTVEYGKARLLITGDAERERMEEFKAVLDSTGASLDYTLVKMPHHGSYTKGIDAVLRAVTPRYCVVCVDDSGAEASTVTLMRAVGAATYYTHSGDVHFVTNGTGSVLVVK
jgi:beta-lactamase superfamily II metal-dependent hydrolase